MRSAVTFVLALIVLSLPHRAAAAPITIDFDALAEFQSVGATFPGLTFNNATVLTAGSSLNDLEFPPHSGLNGVFDDGGAMSIGFDTPVFSIGGFFTYAGPLTLTLFDTSNNTLGTVTSLFASNLGLSGQAGSNPNELLQFISGVGIGSVLITAELAGGSFVMDDLTFDTSPSPIPEPGTLSLLLLGAGAALLRRRRAQRVA